MVEEDFLRIDFDEGDGNSTDFSALQKLLSEDEEIISKGDKTMPNKLSENLKETLETLSGISGFVAAGIYNGSGDVLATNDKKGFKFNEIGSFALELYKNAKSISDKMGLGLCNFIETHTQNFIFVHMCIIPGKGAIGVLLSQDGNIGLARHLMKKEGERLIPDFQ